MKVTPVLIVYVGFFLRSSCSLPGITHRVRLAGVVVKTIQPPTNNLCGIIGTSIWRVAQLVRILLPSYQSWLEMLLARSSISGILFLFYIILEFSVSRAFLVPRFTDHIHQASASISLRKLCVIACDDRAALYTVRRLHTSLGSYWSTKMGFLEYSFLAYFVLTWM